MDAHRSLHSARSPASRPRSSPTPSSGDRRPVDPAPSASLTRSSRSRAAEAGSTDPTRSDIVAGARGPARSRDRHRGRRGGLAADRCRYVAKTSLTGGQWRAGGGHPLRWSWSELVWLPRRPSRGRTSSPQVTLLPLLERDRHRPALRPASSRPTTCPSTSPRARCSASSGPTAPASRRCSSLVTGTSARRRPRPLDGDDVTRLPAGAAAAPADRPYLPGPPALRGAHRVRERARRLDLRLGRAQQAPRLPGRHGAGRPEVRITDAPARSLRLLDRKRLELARALADRTAAAPPRRDRRRPHRARAARAVETDLGDPRDAAPASSGSSTSSMRCSRSSTGSMCLAPGEVVATGDPHEVMARPAGTRRLSRLRPTWKADTP